MLEVTTIRRRKQMLYRTKENSWGWDWDVRFCDFFISLLLLDFLRGTIFSRDSIVNKTNITNAVYHQEGILENTLS